MNSGHFNPGTVVSFQSEGSDPEVFYGLYSVHSAMTRYIRAASGAEAKTYLHGDEVLLPQVFTIQPVA